MNLAKRFLAGAIAVTSVFSLVGCGKDEKKNENSATTTTTVKATLKEQEVEIIQGKVDTLEGLPDVQLENKEVKWLAHYAMNPNTDQAASADLKLFELKYGGKVVDNVTTWEARYTDLASLVLSDNAPDCFPADDMDAFPKGAIRGMFQPIDDYVNYDDALWTDVSKAADSFAIKDDHYVAIIEVQPNIVCMYNRKTMEAEGFDDPAELLAKGEWTLDVFIDMCKEFINADEEKYSLDGFWYYDAIQQTTGLPMIQLTEDGTLKSNLSDPKIEAVENLMYDLSKSAVVWPRKDHNWETRCGNYGTGMGEGKTLFIPQGLWGITAVPGTTATWGDVEKGEVMFVPMPLNTDGGNETHYVSSRVNGYLLCSGAKNPEGFAALMACKRACNLDEDIRKLGEDQLRNDYKWTEEMIDMKNTIYEMALENPVFEFHQGVTDELATLFANTICSSTMNDGGEGTTSWTETVAANKGTVDWLINEANSELTK